MPAITKEGGEKEGGNGAELCAKVVAALSEPGTNKISLRKRGREERPSIVMRVKLSNGRAKAKAVNAQLGEIYMLHDRFVNGTTRGRGRESSRAHLWEWGGLFVGDGQLNWEKSCEKLPFISVGVYPACGMGHFYPPQLFNWPPLIRCLQVAAKINAMARTPRGLSHVSVLYLLPPAEL